MNSRYNAGICIEHTYWLLWNTLYKRFGFFVKWLKGRPWMKKLVAVALVWLSSSFAPKFFTSLRFWVSIQCTPYNYFLSIDFESDTSQLIDWVIIRLLATYFLRIKSLLSMSLGLLFCLEIHTFFIFKNLQVHLSIHSFFSYMKSDSTSRSLLHISLLIFNCSACFSGWDIQNHSSNQGSFALIWPDHILLVFNSFDQIFWSKP